jgi:branched-chain amino acid transport system permease protein
MTAMERRPAMTAMTLDWGQIVRVGLLTGTVGIYLCLVGIVAVFDPRALVTGVMSLGQTALVLTAVGAGYLATRRQTLAPIQAAMAAAAAGAIAGALVAALIVASNLVDLRAIFLHASSATFDVVTFGLGPWAVWVPILEFAIVGGITAIVLTATPRVRAPITAVLLWLLMLGLFAGLVRPPLLASPITAQIGRLLFADTGLTPIGAIVTIVLVLGIRTLRARVGTGARIAALAPERRTVARRAALAIGVLFVLWLPLGVGSFFAQVVAVVALYVLMGLGLNITLGLAGLLDLGFVAFFAVGAYTVGLLTSTAEYGIAGWPFWAAVPFAVIIAMAFGAFFGLPILGIRGDYLAIATLGFGEIIRILAGSDLMKPFLGGPRGIINIPKPIDVPPDSFLAGPLQIYYIALAAAAVVAFVAIRLRASRLGRAWLAIREDEDVAEALGVNLVRTKLLAYMLGAAFAGLGGAIFAGLLGSIFSSSVTLFVSINVAALIIVGGMGSIPGVVVGAIFLIGVPELFREFSEYKFLFYGVALIAMMIFRPEGLLPSRITRRELHHEDAILDEAPSEAGALAPQAGTGAGS